MGTDVPDMRAIIDAWREQGADRLDSVRFHLIDALERRRSTIEGDARHLLDDRLSTLLAAYTNDLAVARGMQPDLATPAPVRSALGELVEAMAKPSAKRDEARFASNEDTRAPSTFPDLAAVEEFRLLWNRVRGESRLRRSLEHVPTNAGPLNSDALIHRSITLMRDLSEDYLQQFLAYVDDLSALEQMTQAAAEADAPRAANIGKRTRGKARVRRE